MELMLLKASNIELCENMYALSINYLRRRNNIELKYLITCLNELELYIRECDDEQMLKQYINNLDVLCDKIEGIINE